MFSTWIQSVGSRVYCLQTWHILFSSKYRRNEFNQYKEIHVWSTKHKTAFKGELISKSYDYFVNNVMKISYHNYSDQNYHGYQYYRGIVNVLKMFKKY